MAHYSPNQRLGDSKDANSRKIIHVSLLGCDERNGLATIRRYANGEAYLPRPPHTIGVEYTTLRSASPDDPTLQLTEAQGGISFRNSFFPKLFANPIIILCYAIDNISSFKYLTDIFNDYKEHTTPNTNCIVLGLKDDSDTLRTVDVENVDHFVQNIEAVHREINLYEKNEVDDFFDYLLFLARSLPNPPSTQTLASKSASSICIIS